MNQTHSTQSPSDSPDMAAEYQEFSRKVSARLEVGAREYGNESFRRPPEELLDEIQQELEDVNGWSFILWTRIERLKRHIRLISTVGL